MKFPVFSLYNRELGCRDEFARDCFLQRRVRCEPDFRLLRRSRGLARGERPKQRTSNRAGTPLPLSVPAESRAKSWPDCVLGRNSPSVGSLNRAAGVTWTRLVFVKVSANPVRANKSVIGVCQTPSL